jgi:predicted hydrocarbon binding protein
MSNWIHSGKERGYSIEGKAFAFEFVGSAETGQASPESICLCPMAEAQAAGKISPTYCLCSVGYVKEMHERILGRPVEVELVDSVLWGGKRCKFKMTVV